MRAHTICVDRTNVSLQGTVLLTAGTHFTRVRAGSIFITGKTSLPPRHDNCQQGVLAFLPHAIGSVSDLISMLFIAVRTIRGERVGLCGIFEEVLRLKQRFMLLELSAVQRV